MSVLVKGMEMPKSCLECVCKHKFFSDMGCYEFSDFEFDGTEKFPHTEDRSLYCPLVPVPPHGRLIDADKLIDDFKNSRAMTFEERMKASNIVQHAYDKLCVIEADKEGAEE